MGRSGWSGLLSFAVAVNDVPSSVMIRHGECLVGVAHSEGVRLVLDNEKPSKFCICTSKREHEVSLRSQLDLQLGRR